MRYQIIPAILFEQNCSMHWCPETMRGGVVDLADDGAIGRTDFPRGNHQHLIKSIRSKLWPLENGMAFFPGHGPISTFARERSSNHFLGDHVR